MKNLFLLAVLAITINTAARAAEIPDRALASFEKHFAGVTNVQWQEEAGSGYRKATFVWGGHRTVAYYSTDGELIGSARGIFFSQVPMNLSKALYKRFDKAIVLDVKEITNSEGVRYILTLEHQKKQYRATINNYGEILSTEKWKK